MVMAMARPSCRGRSEASGAGQWPSLRSPLRGRAPGGRFYRAIWESLGPRLALIAPAGLMLLVILALMARSPLWAYRRGAAPTGA